jgi:SAM-dependent methyltransferase
VELVGVDLSGPMLARARARLGEVVVRGDGSRLPVRDSSVAAVLFSWVLHLVDDARALLAEARRVVRPDGLVVAMLAGWLFDDESDDLSRAQDGLDEATGRRRQTVDDVRLHAADAELLTIDVVQTERAPYSRTPRESADAIESRTWSGLFLVPDDVWATRVVPIIDRVRALPDQDRPRTLVGYQEAVVLAPA